MIERSRTLHPLPVAIINIASAISIMGISLLISHLPYIGVISIPIAMIGVVSIILIPLQLAGDQAATAFVFTLIGLVPVSMVLI